jgi:hypothetical protein
MTDDEFELDKHTHGAIRETEMALILTLSAVRKIKQGEVLQNVAFVTLGFILLMFLASQKVLNNQNAVWVVGLFLAYVLYFQLYHLFGRDSIEANAEEIVVRVGIAPFKRTFRYQAERVTNLRCENTIYQRSRSYGGFGGRGSRTVWEAVVDPDTSMIVCDYDGQETPLVGSINKALARHFVSQVKQHFPNYRS